MTLRSYLTALTLATLFPVAIFAAVVGGFLVQENRETFRRGAEERTLALLTAVDAELQGSIDAIRALSFAASLAEGNLPYFRATAVRALESKPEWININLALPDGTRALDLLAPEGAALPPVRRSEKSFERVLETRKAAVGDLAMGQVAKRWNYTVRVPVMRDGAVKYVLSAVVEPKSIVRLVTAQGLPAGWVGVVLDGNHRIVARTVDPEQSLGKEASQSLRDALARAPSGWFRGSTIEGTEVYTPYRRSETTGWTFAMGIPADAVDAAAWRGVALLGIGLAGAVALAFGLAHLVGRRLLAPIASLVSATEAFARGEAVRVPQAAGVGEIAALARTLQACVEAIREREERFRAMADAAPVLIWVSGTDGLRTWFNKPWLELVGRTMEQELGEGWVQNVHPDDVRRCLDAYRRAFDARQPFDTEYRLRRHDGEFRWLLDRGVARFAPEGGFAGYVGSCIDITDRRQSEGTLRASEERLRLAQQAGRMGSWEWEVPTGKVTWSPELEAIHGLAPGTFAGTFEDYRKDIHPQDWDQVQQAIGRSLDRGDHHVEYRIVRPDGEVRWVEGRGMVFSDAGVPQRVVGVCMDITERKRVEDELRRAEERTRSIVDHVVDAIITIGEHGAIETFNPAAERIFGYAASEVVGQNVKILMPEPYRRDHDDYIASYLRTGKAKIIGIGREVEGRRKDGSTFPMDLAVSEFRMGPRRLFTGIVRDITERKRAEQALKEADRHKDEFLAMLSHELRNPLAALTTAAHVLRISAPEERGAIQARAVVDRQTKHMAHLVEDLLDISRITMGKATLEREDLDLALVVSGVVQTWQAAGRLDGARITLKASPAWVDADRVRMEQIFSNLLDNALKFSPAGEPIAVSVRREGSEARLEVSDQGQGIAPEVLGGVFELFTQGPHGPDRRKGGMGVGLALVKRLVGMHGGSVSAQSAGTGRGAAFTVRLPAIEKRAQKDAPAPERAASGPKRVLVIEDNDDMREMLSAALALGGHDVSVASDGTSGLAAAAASRPDIALIDIGLPDMDGYEVARRLRSVPGVRRIGLIALTGYGQPDDHHRAQDAGFDAHLTKPVAPDKLTQAIGAFR